MTTRQTIAALVRLCIGLATIALVAVLLFSFAAALAVVVEDLVLASGAGDTVPGSRLLRAVTGTEGIDMILGLAITFVAYAALAAAILIEARLRGRGEWRDIVAWHPWNPARTDRRVYLLAAAALAYGFLADFALRYVNPRSEAWITLPEDQLGTLLLGLVAVVIAPIAEELLFRGWIYTDLRRHFGFVTTLVATSAVFAWLHYESTHLYALAVFPIGLALGTMREITGSVKPAIGFHAFNNFLATAFAYLGH